VDLDGVTACYASVARQANGLIDRSPSWWLSNLLVAGDDSPVYRYLVRRTTGQVGGYVIYEQQALHGPRVDYSIACRELVWTDSHSLASLMTFLGYQRAFGKTLHWWGPVDEPLLAWLEYPRVEAHRSEPWMARILDVRGALEQRGYPHAVEASLEFQVNDELFCENSRPMRLVVAGGRGYVNDGRDPVAALDIGALSALYTGWVKAADLARLGRLQTDSDRVRDLFDLVFAGPKPWISERF
jgi:predicted acetyltransferase